MNQQEIAKAVLEETARELEDPESWCQGVGHIRGAGFGSDKQCLSYALTNAYSKVGVTSSKPASPGFFRYQETWHNAWQTIIDAVMHSLPEDQLGGIISFNDAKETTHEDVMLVVKKAIHFVEEGE